GQRSEIIPYATLFRAEAAAAGVRATVASRTNTLFSIPLLFFMVGSSHLGYQITENSQVTLYWIVALIVIGAIQGNALYGKTGPRSEEHTSELQLRENI